MFTMSRLSMNNAIHDYTTALKQYSELVIFTQTVRLTIINKSITGLQLSQPVRQRITFKLAMITFKCLRGLAPSYLADACIPVSSVVGRWQLRSADSGTLVVPRTRTTIGRRDFAVSGPTTWNSLPVELRTSSLSSQTFAKKLKTHLFVC